MPSGNQTTLLVDADTVAYTAAASAQSSVQFPGMAEPLVTVRTAEEAIDAAAAQLDRLQEEFERSCANHGTQRGSVAVILALSDATANWRKEILPSYKANRKAKPVLLYSVRQWMTENYKTFERPKLEGDDIVGILMTAGDRFIKGKKIIVSIDKDLKTIPGRLYNPQKKTKTVVTEQDADYWHMYQTLTGDAVDNYRGCPRVGPVKAEAVLAGHGLLWPEFVWPRVVAAFEAAGLTEDDALVQARVSRILRFQDFDYRTKEILLWQPHPSPTSTRVRVPCSTATSSKS